jgi:23S rRNA (uridine2552-2'-O)-methyltransferase
MRPTGSGAAEAVTRSGRRSSARDGAGRRLHERVKTAKRRSASSARWLERQLNDPYVRAAQREGLRSRAAFKLIELDDRYRLLKPGLAVLDLGAAPGGWTQVAVARVRAGAPGGGRVVAMDLEEMGAVAGAEVLRGDIRDPATPAALRHALGRPADLVLSDMAPAASGHRDTDHLRILALVEAAAELALALLAPGGGFVAKVWQGGTEAELLALLKRRFKGVRHAKPAASRAESAEVYLVCTGFRAEAAD